MAVSAMDKRYAMLRQNLQQQESTQSQMEQDALRRRFASMGSLGSGAAMKAEQKARDASAQRLMQGQGQLDVARLGEEQALEENQRSREFATAERLGGQTFAAEQAGLGRQFQTSERLGGQGFAAEQAGLGRQFATSERLGGQDFSAAQAGLNRAFATSERLGGQEFQTGERRGSQTFASNEAMRAREFTKGERIAGQKFTGEQAGLDRVAQAKSVADQLRNSKDIAVIQADLQRQIFSKEFELNKIIADWNMGGKTPIKLGANTFGVDYGQGMYGPLGFGGE
jgi:hypothetical protein